MRTFIFLYFYFTTFVRNEQPWTSSERPLPKLEEFSAGSAFLFRKVELLERMWRKALVKTDP